ncbi:MAG: hypothetical protein DI598_11480 [Pseudopedobacter saltans]|uniref:Uncharacterized protein n=1 Tax=Pseudopedobacter saltans TaxID=151895 RepID=A0A2W5ESY6_9SPHI|nr:MAG: hypothetical protein DI598_11480 [Pseudopedobacter saltans]
MKKRIFQILGIGLMFWAIMVSCNKSNSSTPLPTMMNYVLNQNWRLDTVIFMEDGVNDTLTMADVPGFSTSNIRFYNRLDSSFVFKDVLNAYLTGPDGRDSIFRYTYGKWAMSPAEDSIYLYSQDTVNARGYAASWSISRIDSTSTLYADYVDTVARTVGDTVFLRKRAVFVKSTFY